MTSQPHSSAAEQVEQTWGPIDVWVNCAIATVFAPVKDVTADGFKRAIEATYLGSVRGTQAALKRVLPRNRGRLLKGAAVLTLGALVLRPGGVSENRRAAPQTGYRYELNSCLAGLLLTLSLTSVPFVLAAWKLSPVFWVLIATFMLALFISPTCIPAPCRTFNRCHAHVCARTKLRSGVEIRQNAVSGAANELLWLHSVGMRITLFVFVG